MLVWGFLWAGLLLLVTWSWRRSGRWPIFGPIFIFDLVRSARRRHLHLLRSLYLGLVLLCLGLAYYASNPYSLFENVSLSPRQAAQFEGSLFLYFVLPQWGLVVIGVPILSVDMLATERQRKTLDFLLASPLQASEILWGKLLARLCSVFFFLCAGLPVASFLYLLGGVDPNLVVFHVVAGLATACSLGALSVLCSTLLRSLSQARTLTFLVAFLFLGGAGHWYAALLYPYSTLGNLVAALSLLFESEQAGTLAEVLPWLLQDYVFAHAVLGFLALCIAQHLLARDRAGPVLVSGIPQPLAQSQIDYQLSLLAQQRREEVKTEPQRPPVSDFPIRWRERHSRSGTLVRVLADYGIYLILLPILPSFLILVYDIFKHEEMKTLISNMHTLHDMIARCGSILFCFLGLRVALRSAQAIASERQYHTLESLLTLPYSRAELLREKFLACLLSVQTPWRVLLAVWFLGTVVGSLHPLSFLLLVVGSALLGVSLTSLGLCISVLCQTVFRARLLLLISLVLLHTLLPLLSCGCIYSPVEILWSMHFPLFDNNLNEYFLGKMFLSHLFYVVLSGLSYRLALNQFRRVMEYE